ncbi:MAG TPA: type IV secretion system DNA-binding domain-containing protein [Jatrophihabitans sp.]|nr:type IV secretion system DNA-binding domain-containing protein [Jatrophihabitans sp.]
MPVTRPASRRPAPKPSPTGSQPGGPLGRYLRDPGGSLHHLEHAAIQWAIHWGPLAATLIALAGVTLMACRIWWRRRQHAELARDARLVTVLAPPVVDPAGAAALWSNLTGLLRPAWRRRLTGQPHVAFEYAFDSDGLTLRLWVPGVVPPGMVEHAIQAAWPGAHTSTQPVDATGERPTKAPASTQRRMVSGGELRLARSEALPIRTGFDADPIRALLGAPAGLLPGERAVVQVLARPVTSRRVARARRAATRLHTGTSTRPVGRLLDLITPGAGAHRNPSTRSSREAVPDRFTSLEYSAQDRAAAGKQRGALFETRLRYTLTTPVRTDATKATVASAGDRLRGRAHAIASAFAVFAEHNHYLRRRLRHPDRVVESRRLGRGDLLSIPELAAIAHIPTDAFAPGLQQAGARALPPPPGIPTPSSSNAALVKPLGHADTGRHRPVGLAVADARHHTHLLGATGSGKSTLLAQLVLADADAGRGAVVIDPKGDLITDILDRLPRRVDNRVVLMDADSRATPPCLNPLDADPDLGPTPATIDDVAAVSPGEDVHSEGELDGRAQVVVDNLTSIFARVYSAFWGPRTDDIFRAACLTLRAQPHTPGKDVPSLADVPTLLTDPGYRDTATAHVSDPVLSGFWDWYDGLSDAARAQAIAPLMNKVRAFLLRPFVKAAIAGGPTTLDMRAVLDHGGICLIRIPKGSLGEETTRLVGSLVVASVWQTATARAAIPQNLRSDCGLYVDECQNFLNLPYPLEDMLAEARGFRLAMTLAHQHLGQLSRDLHDGIAANARNKIFFTASPDDARQLARHTAPRLSEHDLAHLDAFHAAARLVVAGQATAPFTFTTTPLPAVVPGAARAIRRASAHGAKPTRRHVDRAGRAVATVPERVSGMDPRLELASQNDSVPNREREGS